MSPASDSVLRRPRRPRWKRTCSRPGPWTICRPRRRMAHLMCSILVQRDADVHVEQVTGRQEPAAVMASARYDTGGGIGQVPLVDVVPRRPEMPVAPPRRKANQGEPVGSPARRSQATRTTKTSTPSSTAFCPYCALPLQSAPVSSQRCARCRQRFIVKRVDGRAIYLTEAAVPVFVAERRRVAASARLTRERDRWLRLAAAAGSPARKPRSADCCTADGRRGRSSPDAVPDHDGPRLQGRQT